MLSPNDELTETKIKIEDPTDSDNEELSPLRCWDCNVNFMNKFYLHQHLLFHIKQPSIVLHRVQQAPIKITLKSKSGNSFEIISSPPRLHSPTGRKSSTEEETYSKNLAANDENTAENEECSAEKHEYPVNSDALVEKEEDLGCEDHANVFSPNFVSDNINGDKDDLNTVEDQSPENTEPAIENESDYGTIPGAEPTPPPEPSPEYPKIRIKTTGLLKESSVTITEITEDNNDGTVRAPDIIELGPNTNNKHGSPNYNNESDSLWATPSLEDPLRLPDNEKEDNNLLSLFSGNNERAKDLGFTSSDSEFISLDRLDDRNHNAMQVYNSHAATSSTNQNSLDSLTGLPMQQLAQQVSRLQPGNGMHQQNVLINIQQFPQAPPQQHQHGYQPPPPPIYHQPPMYPPYYQPPNHMYYSPTGYPPQHMAPPPPPQMGQHPQQAMGQHQQSMNQHQQQQINQHHPQQMNPQQQLNQQPMPMQQSNQYGQQSMPPRPPVQRQPVPTQRPQMGPRPLGPRQPMHRQRGPVPRPRGGGMGVRGPRPRMPNMVAQNIQQQGQINHQRVVKRTSEQIQSLQAKRKKMDILVPDKNDDADCQVICTQPKNMDGGLPQIQSVQGGTPDPSDNNIMHLSDSITLSVRNPPARTESPKKSDAKDVANILATRGITVTATAKPKEKAVEAPPKKSTPPPPVAINLNNAVSIIPTAKQNNASSNTNANSKSSPSTLEQRLPTVDLTDDSAPETAQPVQQSKQQPPPQQRPNQRGGLPFRCDLCPAQYPNAAGLNKHRQMYHKTGGPCEIGVPLINLKQTGVLQKLSSLGIFNYIPLPGASADGTFAIPVINARNPGNINGLGATSVLTLGPIRNIPRPQNSTSNHVNNTNVSNSK